MELSKEIVDSYRDMKLKQDHLMMHFGYDVQAHLAHDLVGPWFDKGYSSHEEWITDMHNRLEHEDDVDLSIDMTTDDYDFDKLMADITIDDNLLLDETTDDDDLDELIADPTANDDLDLSDLESQLHESATSDTKK